MIPVSTSTAAESRPTFQSPTREDIATVREFPIAEMRDRRQWCGFRITPQPGGKPGKTPVMAPDARRSASSTDPKTWNTFRVAVEGLEGDAYSAIAYALNGDIVGIDLDGERWVDADGKLTDETVELVGRCASYAELSFSGKGIHILIRGNISGRRSVSKKGVEVYDRGRFLIATGRMLAQSPAALNANQGAIDWIYRTYFDAPSPSPEPTGSTEGAGMASVGSVDSVDSVLTVEEAVKMTLPKKEGERNARIFDLARALKFDAGMGNAKVRDCRPIVERWYQEAKPVIRTKDFDETWADFIRALHNAKFPLRTAPLLDAFEQARTGLLPKVAANHDSEAVRLLVGMCWHLAKVHPEKRFFLSSHDAGKLLDIGHHRAISYLHMLCAEGVLELVKHGNARRANRYRFIGEAEPDDETARDRPEIAADCAMAGQAVPLTGGSTASAVGTDQGGVAA